ncbi:S-adenosyl-L-methionine-dependent methyltransferase [Tirmania nivea]|nr:S-adenosyl-L-methionine-dependent methyltransferase [Tirmania nivea]
MLEPPRRERVPLRLRAPVRKEDINEITLSVFPFKSWSLSPNGAVELISGEYLRINQIINRLTMHEPDYNVGKSEIFLKGKLFERATPLQYLHNKKNEVVMKDDGVKVKLEEVHCPRELIMTNAPFPEFRGEELLVCRWVWGIIEGMKYQGLIRRVSEIEADEDYRISGHLLRSQWRTEKLNELRFQEEQKKQAAIEKSRQRKAEIRAKNAYTIDLERESFCGKQPPPSSSETSCPVTPKSLFLLDMDEDYYTGTRPVHSQSASSALPSFQTPRVRRKAEVGGSSRTPNPISPIVLIEDENQEDMPLLQLHREDTFTNYRTGQTNRASHTMDLGQFQSTQTFPLQPTAAESLNTNPVMTNMAFSMVRENGGLEQKASYSRRRLRNPPPNTHLPKGPPKYTFGDAFCGAGGMSRAADMAHFRVTWGVDCDEPAILAYQMNFPAATPYHTHVDQLLRNLNESILVDVLHISPPCQPYSQAHTVAGKNDESNEAALFAITGLLEASRPRFATVEQTDGILNHEFLPALMSPFLDKGFSVAFKVLYGSEYGVPQLRKRLVVIAAGPGEILPPWPAPTHYTGKPEPNLPPTPTIHDIISQIPLDATEHEFRPYQIPRAPKDPHRQCRTLMAGGSDQEYHPSGLRPFTIREKACLQTFPNDHAFSGSCTTKQRQIGNAVPPLLGRAILNEVRKALEEADEEDRLRQEEERTELEFVEGFGMVDKSRAAGEKEEVVVIRKNMDVLEILE